MALAVTRVKPVEKKKDKCLRPMVPLIILLKSLEYLVKSIGRVPEAIFKEDAGLPYALVDVAADRSICLLYTSPSPRDLSTSRMPSSA